MSRNLSQNCTIFQFILVSVLLTVFFSIEIECSRPRKLEDTPCKPSDYHFEFTVCDSSGSAWRVAIPSSGCENVISPIPPKRSDCYKSCAAGQFLNLTSLECENCELGTYSLGGGLRFEEWDPLPPGFKVQVEKFHSIFSTIGRQYSNVNCSKWGWRSRGGEVLLSQGGPCVATLTFSAQLVKPGSLKFTYQYSDDSVLFQFQANSDQCERLREADESRWPPLTGEGIWRTEEIPLRTGLNIFQWKTMGLDRRDKYTKPVLIKKIEIDGVGYTSSCQSCSPGTFSNSTASNTCYQCPKNTYSDHKSSSCISCSMETEYSEVGSPECNPRPPCSPSDYYQVHTPCNENNQTRVEYKWVEPKICLESHPNSVKLPPPGLPRECPACNPGTEYRDGQCVPCSPNQYSDGAFPCQKCPSNTVADTGHHLIQWYTWPPGVHTTCISPENNGCNQAPAYILNGTSVMSGNGHADWVYLVLTLTVNGFRGRGGIVNGELLEVGRLSFSFEMKCLHECELLFMQGTSSKNASVIQRWVGSSRRQTFTHHVVRNDTYSYSWAFQKLAWESANSDGILRDDNQDSVLWSKGDGSWGGDSDNVVRIFNINVTNSIDGGATKCVECRDGLVYSSNGQEQGACVTCSPGHYRADTLPPKENGTNNTGGINLKSQYTRSPSSTCQPCPPGTVSVDPFARNANSCKPCGSGLISKDGLTCTTDCVVHLHHRTYDLRPLKGFQMVRGNSLFTASGTQYYHMFNISFCAEQNAACYKNVSLQHGYESQNTKVESLVCQSTVFPPTVSSSIDATDSYINQQVGGFSQILSKPLSTHASSLGDHLIGISHLPTIKGVSIEENLNDMNNHPQQFHFFYSTPEPTIACPKGRSTTITFRCRLQTNAWTLGSVDTTRDIDRGNSRESEIRAPEKCPDATCDGCNFHFIWETQYACHLCTEAELKIIYGECKDGQQEIHYLPSEFSQCLLKHNTSWPNSQPCKNHLPVIVEIAIQLAIGLTALLSVILICFWRRHRKLEYKYMKLVASGGNNSSSNSRNSNNIDDSNNANLPVAECCALEEEDDDEEEDHYDQTNPQLSSQIKEVSFYSDSSSTLKTLVSKFSILNRIKTLTRKGEQGSTLEIMNLTDKEAIS